MNWWSVSIKRRVVFHRLIVTVFRSGKDDRYSELELTAVQAMSAVLCCGPVFDPSGLNDDGYIYSWLDTLLGAHEEKVCAVIEFS